MALPVEFIVRFAVPSIIALLLLQGNDPEQTALYDKVLEESDKVLAAAKGEGEGPTETYDYIIIGAGSTGSVLANRLTASGEFSVLLLEAGGDPNPISEVPYSIPSILASEMFLDYKSIPQKEACLANGGVM